MSFHTQLNRISYNGDKEERQRERERKRERERQRELMHEQKRKLIDVIL